MHAVTTRRFLFSCSPNSILTEIQENICRLLDSYTDPQQICLVLEFIDGGDLLDYIIKWEGPGLPETEAADFTFQICRAMAYCVS